MSVNTSNHLNPNSGSNLNFGGGISSTTCAVYTTIIYAINIR